MKNAPAGNRLGMCLRGLRALDTTGALRASSAGRALAGFAVSSPRRWLRAQDFQLEREDTCGERLAVIVQAQAARYATA